MGDLEDMRELRERFKGHARTVTERRTMETRVPSYNSRRKMAKTDRTEQTNLKFTPAEKKRLIALAEASGETMVEYIVRAIELRAEAEAKA